MKRNGRLTITIIAIVASVFFISCGIPTYCTLDSISISSKSSQDGSISFSISGDDSSLPDVKEGPGLLLIYTNSSSALASDFKSSYISDSVNGRPVVVSDQNTGYFATLGTEERNLYTFKNIEEESESWPSAWKYNLDLTSYHEKISAGTLILSLSYEDGIYSLSDGENIIGRYKRGEEVSFSDNDIYIFAAVTTQGTSQNLYSNVYWTSLVYIGKISETVSEEESAESNAE